jgi:Hypothetical protein (DUF2513)
MTRDMDLIRAIVIEVEQQPVGQLWSAKPMLEHNHAEVVEHVRLAQESGLVEARFAAGPHAVILRLTNSGHDFVEAARPQTFWQKAKDRVTAQGVPLTIYSVRLALDILIKDGLSHIH